MQYGMITKRLQTSTYLLATTCRPSVVGCIYFGRPEEARLKLAEFLDSFQKYYMELVQGGYLVEVSLDKIYGDLGDILVEMVEVIERLVNNDKC